MTSHGLDLLPLRVTCLWLVALTAVLITHGGHFVRMGGQHRRLHASHVLMLFGMLYMWMPNWVPALTWTLVVYYALETVAWLGGGLDDSKPMMAFLPMGEGSAVDRVCMAIMAASMGYMFSAMQLIEKRDVVDEVWLTVPGASRVASSDTCTRPMGRSCWKPVTAAFDLETCRAGRCPPPLRWRLTEIYPQGVWL